jgi:hypothetical protein
VHAAIAVDRARAGILRHARGTHVMEPVATVMGNVTHVFGSHTRARKTVGGKSLGQNRAGAADTVVKLRAFGQVKVWKRQAMAVQLLSQGNAVVGVRFLFREGEETDVIKPGAADRPVPKVPCGIGGCGRQHGYTTLAQNLAKPPQSTGFSGGVLPRDDVGPIFEVTVAIAAQMQVEKAVLRPCFGRKADGADRPHIVVDPPVRAGKKRSRRDPIGRIPTDSSGWSM